MRYYQKTRSEVLKYVTSAPRSVLEIGCGAGMFGALLKDKFACVVIGVELESRAAKIAQSKLDKVYTEKIETLIKSGRLCKDFDLIVLNDVIEHIDTPSEFLMCLKSILAHKGLVIASIPNFIYVDNIARILLKKDFKYENSGILDQTHLRFFTKKSIKRLFQDSGYTVELLEPLNFNTSLKWKMINIISFGWFNDFTVYQYIIRASAE